MNSAHIAWWAAQATLTRRGGLAQASEKTPVELKIALLEYLGTNRSSPDSMDIIPFLLGRIKHEPHDKTRACAVLALSLMFRFVAAATTGNYRQVGGRISSLCQGEN